MNMPGKKKKKAIKMRSETIQPATFKLQLRKYRSELDLPTGFSHNINTECTVEYSQYLSWCSEKHAPCEAKQAGWM